MTVGSGARWFMIARPPTAGRDRRPVRHRPSWRSRSAAAPPRRCGCCAGARPRADGPRCRPRRRRCRRASSSASQREQERLQREADHDRGQHERLRDRDRSTPVSLPTIGGTPGRLPATTSSRLTPLPIRPTPTTMRVRLRCSIEYVPVAKSTPMRSDQDEAHDAPARSSRRLPPPWVRDARWLSTMMTTPITSR